MTIREWLFRTLIAGQVRACTGEVKIYLDDADEIERASVLLIAQMYRHDGFAWDSRMPLVIDSPFSFPPVDAGAIFSILRDAVFQSQRDIKIARLEYAKLGVAVPDWQERQFRRTRMALQVWMATVGTRIVRGTVPAVRAIWTMLHGSLSSISAALSQMKDFERRVGGTLVPAERAFARLDEEAVLSFCGYVPRLEVPES